MNRAIDLFCHIVAGAGIGALAAILIGALPLMFPA